MIIVFQLCREKKREKERDELWKRLGELEINYKAHNNLNSKSSNDSNSNFQTTNNSVAATVDLPN